jgi:hypothetical protein
MKTIFKNHVISISLLVTHIWIFCPTFIRLFFNFYDKFIELFNFLFTNTRGNKTHKKIPQKLLILPFCGIVELKFLDVQTREKYQKIKLKIEKLIKLTI